MPECCAMYPDLEAAQPRRRPTPSAFGGTAWGQEQGAAKWLFDNSLIDQDTADGYLAAAYKCGASGYFAKGDDLEDIVSGVKEVARSDEGVFVLGPKVKQRCQPPKPAGLAGRSRSKSKSDQRPATALETLTARGLK